MKFVLLGDSLTHGYVIERQYHWSALLAERYPAMQFCNRGICGDTTGGMLARFRYDVGLSGAKYVSIMGGTNDFIAGVPVCVARGNLMAMVYQAYAADMIPIIGIAPLVDSDAVCAAWRNFAAFERVNARLSGLRQWILQFCQTFGVYSIDLYQCFENASRQDGASLFADGIHPNAAGNRLIAEAFDALLQTRVLAPDDVSNHRKV